jgi:hypothetical protein
MDYSKLLPGRSVASPLFDRAKLGVPSLADQEPDARCFSLLDCILTIELPTGKKTVIKKVILQLLTRTVETSRPAACDARLRQNTCLQS